MTRCVALLRGINVGRARRVAMVDLRALVEGLGHAGVSTLLNSGNVIFTTRRPNPTRIAKSIAIAVQGSFGFAVHVVVLTQTELHEIVTANPLRHRTQDTSRLLVAFAASDAALDQARPLLSQDWAPDEFALTERAAYLWCARGIIESKLMQAFARATGESATARNWATVLKLHAAVQQDAPA